MTLYHVTPAVNVESILSLGVAVRYSLTKLRRMWFCRSNQRGWAKNHVAKRHKCKMRNLAVVVVHVPEEWLRPAWDGVWTCDRDVPPAHIAGVHFCG